MLLTLATRCGGKTKKGNICLDLPRSHPYKLHETSGGSKDMFPNIIQTPLQVATELIRALKKRDKPKVVPGQ